MRKRLPILLITLGIMISAYPLVGEAYTNWQQYRFMQQLEDTFSAETVEETDTTSVDDSTVAVAETDTTEDIAASEPSEAVTTSTVPEPEVTPAASPSPKPVKRIVQKVLGSIQINKIKVKYPIVEGVKAENLRVAIGHIPGTAGLGEVGNTALAGHRSHAFGKFFNRLDELEAGDEIIITVNKKSFKYVVYDKLVVDPTDTSVLRGTKKNKVVTLITCTPLYSSTHRLVIHAQMVQG